MIINLFGCATVEKLNRPSQAQTPSGQYQAPSQAQTPSGQYQAPSYCYDRDRNGWYWQGVAHQNNWEFSDAAKSFYNAYECYLVDFDTPR